jgi:hypothetical protein
LIPRGNHDYALAELVEELPWSGTGSNLCNCIGGRWNSTRKICNSGASWVSAADSRRYQESLDAFNRTVVLVAGRNTTWHFTALTGAACSAGHRDAAVGYKQALALSGNPTMQHSQFSLVMNRARSSA